MILFLDFDGVLHPFPMGPDDVHFSAVASLWALLDRFPEISVVITSTWRERYTFEELVGLLRSHGGESYTDRFVGVTPVFENDREYVPGVRQREIESWLSTNRRQQEPFIIIDDIEEYFDSACRNLYLVDGTTGLTMEDIESIALVNGFL